MFMTPALVASAYKVMMFVSQPLFLTLSCFHVSVNVGGPDLSLVTGQRRFVRTLFFLLLLSVVNCEHALGLVDQMWEQCSLHVMLFCGILPERCHMQQKGSCCIVGRNGTICRHDDRSSILSFARHYIEVLCRNTTYLWANNTPISLCCTLC